MPEGEVVQVEVLPAAPNKLCTEAQRQAVLFLRFSKAVPCAECGTRSRHHWTMRVSFATVLLESFVAQTSLTVHLPFAPVCRSHQLAPAAWPTRPRRARAKQGEAGHA
jgi:hypothetical protein